MIEPSGTKNQEPVSNTSHQDVAQWLQGAGTWPLLILGICFAAQFCLFYQYVHREILWAYPIMWDQTRYLQESHDVLRLLLTKGFPRGLIHALASTTPNGNLLPVEAGFSYLFFGDSRLTALSVLFFHWIVFQAAAVATIRWLSGRWSLAIIGLALLLLAGSPFQETGGLSDFRIDFAAFCTFGLLICVVIRSNLFAHRRFGLLAAAVASYLILLRFITLVYLAGISVLFLVGIAILWLLRRQPRRASIRAQARILNLSLVGGLTLAVCLPAIWHNRKAIQQYYVVGHVTGEEKHIRAQESGIGSTLDSVLYYPSSVWTQHTGPSFRWAAGALILLSLLAGGLWRKADHATGASPVSERLDAPLAYVFFFACLLGPYSILTADVSKSPVVGGILVPPLWAMIAVGAAYAMGTHRSLPVVQRLPQALTGLAALFLGVALCYQISSYGRQGRLTSQRGDVERVLELHDLVGQKCREFGLQTPAIGSDRNADSFLPGVLALTQWERNRIVLYPHAAYPQGIFAVPEQEVMAGLRASDFLLLTLAGGPQNSAYPFDRSMQAIQSKLIDYCDREMVALRETSFFGRIVRLYMRPMVAMETPNADWITDDGMTLHGTSAVLRRFPRITLHGSTLATFHFPDDDRNMTATLELEDRPPLPVPATFAETNGQYTIQLVVPPLDVVGDSPVSIRLRFRRYFVPRDLGLNDDTRHLVIRLPEWRRVDQERHVASLRTALTSGWYPVENSGTDWLCWTDGRGQLSTVASNAMVAQISGQILAAQRPNDVDLIVNGSTITSLKIDWSGWEFRDFGPVALPLQAGTNTLEFVSHNPPIKVGTDTRALAVAIRNLSLTAPAN